MYWNKKSSFKNELTVTVTEEKNMHFSLKLIRLRAKFSIDVRDNDVYGMN